MEKLLNLVLVDSGNWQNLQNFQSTTKSNNLRDKMEPGLELVYKSNVELDIPFTDLLTWTFGNISLDTSKPVSSDTFKKMDVGDDWMLTTTLEVYLLTDLHRFLSMQITRNERYLMILHARWCVV